jgi:hypothetical protein
MLGARSTTLRERLRAYRSSGGWAVAQYERSKVEVEVE